MLSRHPEGALLVFEYRPALGGLYHQSYLVRNPAQLRHLFIRRIYREDVRAVFGKLEAELQGWARGAIHHVQH